MKKILLSFFVILSFSCSKKTTQEYINSGNYDAAIKIAVDKLRSNKTSKSNQEYIVMLEDAYAKANERDLEVLENAIQKNQPRESILIYNTLINLDDRQELIKPLVPLTINVQNRAANFKTQNYGAKIFSAKNAMSDFLLKEADLVLKTGKKPEIRKAHESLLGVEKINPNYKNLNELLEQTKAKGIDYVSIVAKNQSDKIIPNRLQNDLLDIQTYDMQDMWTVYESNLRPRFKYDYSIVIRFTDIQISPEQIKEREFNTERNVVRGKKNKLDANGKPILDENRKPVQEDNIVKISAIISEVKQLKQCSVYAIVDIFDAQNKQVEQIPLNTTFVFTHVYSKCDGDREAIDTSYWSNFSNRIIPFPSNEQMVYDTGEDLKLKFKQILTQNNRQR